MTGEEIGEHVEPMDSEWLYDLVRYSQAQDRQPTESLFGIGDD